MPIKRIMSISVAINLMFLLFFAYIVHTKGGIPYVMTKVSSVFVNSENAIHEHGAYYDNRISVFGEKSEKGGIIFLGDSLTDNNEWQEAIKEEKVFNRGIFGDTTIGILDRLKQVTDAKPSKVFIMIGINDLSQQNPKEEVLKSYSLILEGLAKDSPDTSIYIYSILPTNPHLHSTKIKNEDVVWLNGELLKISKEKGYTFIDLFPLFADEKGDLKESWTEDGVHLTGNAYEVWENAIRKYVKTN